MGVCVSGSAGGHGEQIEEAAGRQRSPDEQHHQQVRLSLPPASVLLFLPRPVCLIVDLWPAQVDGSRRRAEEGPLRHAGGG